MDHQHLQEGGEEVRRDRSGRSDPSSRPSSATNNLRRISTEMEDRPTTDRRNLSTPDDMNEDSFNFPTARSYSWESQSDSEDRGGNASRSSSRRERKFDMTTPTLIDEDEGCLAEEEEIASLQRGRLRQEREGGYTYREDESLIRRTPGASMYRSSFQEEQMRRTPGAGDMHRSAAPAANMPPQEQTDESAVLGFGLTLSTPVATGSGPRKGHVQPWEAQSASSSSTPPRTNQTTETFVGAKIDQEQIQQQQQQQQQSRPPRAPGSGAHQPQQLQQLQQQQRGVFTFTPWTGAQLESRHGSCSPNTLRLTEDLGNLLLEEEDSAEHANQQMFRGFASQNSSASGNEVAGRETSAESWTASYVFKSEPTDDIPSRVPRSSMGRGRRGKNDIPRRSRGYDRSNRGTDEQRQQVASFLQYAQQPKPVRNMQPAAFSNPFMSGGLDASNAGAYPPGDQTEQPSPRLFNFGGAFAPPAKDSSVNFQPPGTAASLPNQPTEPGNRSTLFAFPQPQYQQLPFQQQPLEHQSRFQQQQQQQHDRPPFIVGQAGAFSGDFQTHSFQPLPPMAGASRESPFQHQYSTSNLGYTNATVSSSPTFDFSAVSPYPAQLQGPASSPYPQHIPSAGSSPYPQPSSAPPNSSFPQPPSGPAASPYPQYPSGPSASPYPQHPSGPSASPYPQHPSGLSASPYPQHPSGPSASPYPQHPSGLSASPYSENTSGSVASRYNQHPAGGDASPFTQNPRAEAMSSYSQHPQGGATISHPPHASGMQATAHEFYPMTAVPLQQQRPGAHFPTPPPPDWSGHLPTHMVGTAVTQAATWQGSNPSWVPGGDYLYGVPQQMEGHMGMSPAPPHMSPSWQDHGLSPGADFPPQHPNFSGVPPTHLEGPEHPIPVAAPTPVFAGPSSQGRRDQQQQRPKGKKGQTRRGSKPGKQEKGKRPDSSASNAPAPQQQRKATPVNTSGTMKSKKKHASKGRDSQTSEISGAGTASACSTPSNVPTPANVPGGDEGHGSASEDPADAKRSELIESPATRSAFKDFYRKFRSEERSSFQGAEDYAIQSLADGSLPEKVHWRVYLELADLAKRSNRFADARRLYQQVCQLQPYASQGWLEYSKLEEECGHLNRGARILRTGLEYCEYSENLLTRAIKHEEKMGNLSRARELLARLKHIGIEKVWRTVLEGALLEARAGNVVMARRVLKYLMHHVPWYGPLYLEAYRLERDLGRTDEALEIVERGLAAIPRYGPLWFGAFRLCEEIDRSENDYDLTRTMTMIDRATECISKELIWKVHLDAAQMLERAALDLRENLYESTEEIEEDFELNLTSCRQRFAMTILNCPPNLRWKVWLAAGRMEIAVGNLERARSLFLRAHQVVPDKGRSTTLLECARLEEFAGEPELASAILCKSRVTYGADWKVWLESVLLEIRVGNHARAIELAKGALEIHSGTGRLWASLVQLRYFDGGEEAQFTTLKRALNAVPKSGEVWCEAGRIHLNPFSQTFNLERARRHLFFATRFTPQYGDSFLETLRLELLEQWVTPIATLVWESTKGQIIDCDKSGFGVQLAQYINNIFSELLIICGSNGMSADSGADTGSSGIIDEDTAAQIRQRLKSDFREGSVDLSELELRCANADPNYGLLWFHCRLGPTDTARRILSRATEKVVTELRKFVHIYIAAMIRFSATMAALAAEQKAEVDDSKDALPSLDDEAAWEDLIDKKLFAVPSLNNIYMEKNRGKGMVFLENIMTASVFATGLAELNKHKPTGELSLSERRKELFGTDALFS